MDPGTDFLHKWFELHVCIIVFETVGIVCCFKLLNLVFVHSQSFCFAPHQDVVVAFERPAEPYSSRDCFVVEHFCPSLVNFKLCAGCCLFLGMLCIAHLGWNCWPEAMIYTVCILAFVYIVYVVFYQVELIKVCPYFRGDCPFFGRSFDPFLCLFGKRELDCRTLLSLSCKL